MLIAYIGHLSASDGPGQSPKGFVVVLKIQRSVGQAHSVPWKLVSRAEIDDLYAIEVFMR